MECTPYLTVVVVFVQENSFNLLKNIDRAGKYHVNQLF